MLLITLQTQERMHVQVNRSAQGTGPNSPPMDRASIASRKTYMDTQNATAAGQPTVTAWQKSRRSNPSGNCVEVAELADGTGVAVRNSRDPNGPVLDLHPRRDRGIHPRRSRRGLRPPGRLTPAGQAARRTHRPTSVRDSAPATTTLRCCSSPSVHGMLTRSIAGAIVAEWLQCGGGARVTTPQAEGGPAGGPTVLRMLLGAHLRRLREAQGVTREEAGWEIRASESKISRMELGRVSFKERDIADLLTLYEVDRPGGAASGCWPSPRTRTPRAGGTASATCCRAGSTRTSVWRRRPR